MAIHIHSFISGSTIQCHKCGETSSTTSKRPATSSHRRISVDTCNVSQSHSGSAEVKNEYGITAY